MSIDKIRSTPDKPFKYAAFVAGLGIAATAVLTGCGNASAEKPSQQSSTSVSAEATPSPSSSETASTNEMIATPDQLAHIQEQYSIVKNGVDRAAVATLMEAGGAVPNVKTPEMRQYLDSLGLTMYQPTPEDITAVQSGDSQAIEGVLINARLTDQIETITNLLFNTDDPALRDAFLSILQDNSNLFGPIAWSGTDIAAGTMGPAVQQYGQDGHLSTSIIENVAAQVEAMKTDTKRFPKGSYIQYLPLYNDSEGARHAVRLNPLDGASQASSDGVNGSQLGCDNKSCNPLREAGYEIEARELFLTLSAIKPSTGQIEYGLFDDGTFKGTDATTGVQDWYSIPAPIVGVGSPHAMSWGQDANPGEPTSVLRIWTETSY